jgi:hypothetical protein
VNTEADTFKPIDEAWTIGDTKGMLSQKMHGNMKLRFGKFTKHAHETWVNESKNPEFVLEQTR